MENTRIGQQLEEISEDRWDLPQWEDGRTLEASHEISHDFPVSLDDAVCYRESVPFYPSQVSSCFTGGPLDEHSASEPLPSSLYGLGSAPLSRSLYFTSHISASSEDDARQQGSGLSHEQMGVVDSLAHRGFSIGSLLEFVCILLDKERAFAEIPGLEDAFVTHSGMFLDEWPDLSFFHPASTQTWEVTYRVFVPLTRVMGCAFSQILTGKQRCRAQRMVSHTWGNRFLDTVAACVAETQGKGYYFHIRPRLQTFTRVRDLMDDLGLEALKTSFWICALSVNQHTVACHDSPWPCTCNVPKTIDSPLSEVACFDMLMRFLGESKNSEFAQTIALDDESLVTVEVDCGRRTMRKQSTRASFSFKSTNASDLSAASSLKKFNCPMLGLHIDWRSFCVVKVGDPDVLLSRRVIVGDIVESVNGKFDPKSMRRDLSKGQLTYTITLRRALSVVTRIWVVAEIAEAQKKRIPQHVVPHFPLGLSRPEHKLRVNLANVMDAEASKEFDRAMILDRIEHNAEDYNRSLRQVLLKVPVRWNAVLFGFGMFCATLYFLGRALTCPMEFDDGLPIAFCVVSNLLISCSLVWWMVITVFCTRYWWLALELHNTYLQDDLRLEIQQETVKYLQHSSNPFWTKAFLATRFMLEPSLMRRLRSHFLVIFPIPFFMISVTVMIVCACEYDLFSEPTTNRYSTFCQQRNLFFWTAISFSISVIVVIMVFIEQTATLRGRSAMLFFVLYAPFAILFAALFSPWFFSWPVFCFLLIVNGLILLSFDAFSTPVVRTIKQCRRRKR